MVDSVQEIRYEYKANFGSGTGIREHLNEDGEIYVGGGETGVSLLMEGCVIKVTVEWNNIKESFEMVEEEGDK